MFELSIEEVVAESNLELFTRVDGFKIELFQSSSSSSTALRFTDDQGQEIASFPWWDDVDQDLRRWTVENIPLGNTLQPYTDLDQGWGILIWRREDRVYLAECNGGQLFHSLRWVMADEYTNAWTDALARARRTAEPTA
ncbi:hypothetical protein [Lentzea californiensis]|uniref:hypothetical protein n=1 Tax=Lentzea californiensis TaxID=438851 RepID=UPI0021668168|nr:hypothetical protein [Lentzea californiensis]MCR3750518.1 hypothetical protein [Lentzea californiensis]